MLFIKIAGLQLHANHRIAERSLLYNMIHVTKPGQKVAQLGHVHPSAPGKAPAF